MGNEKLFDILFRELRTLKVIKYVPTNSVLLDIGCGFNGNFIKKIGPKIKEGIGIDKIVNSKQIGNIKLINDHMDNTLPFDSNKFDCVTLIAVIEHLEYPEEILKECHRILNNGGKIIITTPSKKSKSILEFLAFRLKLINPGLIREHKYYFDKHEIKNLLEKVGFKSVVVKYFEFKYNILIVAHK